MASGTDGPWLDIACGPGALTRRLIARAGDRLVVGLDSSGAMLRHAQHCAPQAAFVRADALALPFASDAFGAVVNLAALDLYADAEAALVESVRVLRPGGCWVASCFIRPERRTNSLVHSVWSALASELGMHPLTLQRLVELSELAGLTCLQLREFGNYVLAWASKPQAASR